VGIGKPHHLLKSKHKAFCGVEFPEYSTFDPIKNNCERCRDIYKLPSHYASWNKAMRGAFVKGRKARIDGLLESDCPYQDKRKPSGGLSWSRAFISAWDDGYRGE
jgi:hypothetical protein